MLAALMLSMMLLTTTLLVHAVTTNEPLPRAQPVSIRDRAPMDKSRQFVVSRDR